MNKGKAILISVDDNFLGYATCCINSILSNYPNHPKIFIDYQGASDLFSSKYTVYPGFEVIKLPGLVSHKPGPVKNNIVFNRFHIWGEFFSGYDKILHLDADTIVMKPLEEIFNQNDFYIIDDCRPESHAFLCRDRFLAGKREKSQENQLDSLLAADGYSLDLDSLRMGNAGVFMVPQARRSNTLMNEILELAARYDQYLAYADQSVIALWCALKGISVDQNLNNNFQVRMFENVDSKYPVEDIKVLHFSGESKFYNRLDIPKKMKALFELSDSLRLFYRKIRKEGEAKSYIDAIRDLIASAG